MYLIYLTFLISISASSLFALAPDDFQSPCPGIFVYEADSKKSDTWYGIATVLSDTDTHGVWLKLIFDKHPLQVGNWYGEILIKNETVYEIVNIRDQLKANVPKTVRFFVKYNSTERAPKLIEFLVNGNKVCPEEKIPETKASDDMTTTLRSVNVSLNIERIPLIGQGSPLEEDDFFMGDIYHFLKPPSTIKETSDDDICGTVLTPPNTPLVAYDQLKREGEFPWHVAIYYLKGIDPIYICGGSLISKNFVITVAHCVAKLRSSTHLNPEKLIVYLGKHYLKRFSNEEVQERLISQIILHPQYNAHNYSNDIALLKLFLPVEYNNHVRPVCLWQESLELTEIFKKEGNVIGWGFDDNGKVTEQLMKTEMLAVSQETCVASFPEFFDRFVSQKTYCAGFRNGTSVCNGDSGSGMVFPKSTSSPKNPIWQLRGLVSLSAALHNHYKCDPSNYVVFTDVAKYLDWVNSIIKS